MKRLFTTLLLLFLPAYCPAKATITTQKSSITIADNWHENNELWQELEYIAVGDHKWFDAPEEINDIIKLAKLSPKMNILDLGCGPGRHSLEFARQNFSITGVDITTPYIEKARMLAKIENLTVSFIKDDMRTFCRPNTFDCVVNLFSSFGYFTDQETKKILSNIYLSLKKGGCLVIELINLRNNKNAGTSRRNWAEINGCVVLAETQISKDGTYSFNKAIHLKGTNRKEFTYKIRLYTKKELVALLKACKFTSIKVYENFKGTLYKKGSKHVVAVAYK